MRLKHLPNPLPEDRARCAPETIADTSRSDFSAASLAAMRLRDDVLGSSVLASLPERTRSDLLARVDRPALWRALHSVLQLCGEWPQRSETTTVTAHRCPDRCLLIAVKSRSADSAWLPMRPSQAVEASALPARPRSCAFLENDHRFAAARAVLESLGGRLYGFGESDGVGVAAVLCIPLSKEVGRAVEASPTLAGRTILVVDDCRDLAQSLCEYLRLLGARAIPATCGARAIWQLVRMPFDAMLIDLVMPYPNGYEVARWVRHRPAYDAMRLVASSGLGDRDDLCRSMACGFDAHIVKPPDLSWLAYEVSDRADPAYVHRGG